VKLTDILTPERIVPRLSATDREGVLRELVERGLLGDEGGTILEADDAERVVHSLEERERMQSTGMKDGLAIPHAKIEGLESLVACLGVSPSGVDFSALDEKPSQVFVVLLTPESARGLHLKALARTARLFSDGTLLRRLLELSKGEDDGVSARMFEEVLTEDARY
jgi:PTS system nitrogen regulatory IIA component